MATGNAGDGIGRYLDATSNGYGAVSNAGLPGMASNATSINAPGTYGGMVGLQYFCLLDVPNGYRAFLAGLASPLDALPWTVSSSGSTEQRPSSRPDLHTPRQRAQ
jgi:hypothetical protein